MVACCGAAPPGLEACTTSPPSVPRGIDALLEAYLHVEVRVDTGYQALVRDHPGQVTAPPLKSDPVARLARHLEWQTARKTQSSQRIPVECAIAEAKWWRVLQRFTGRRELLDETINAIAGLVSDRAITW
jgi:hypothetical protein